MNAPTLRQLLEAELFRLAEDGLAFAAKPHYIEVLPSNRQKITWVRNSYVPVFPRGGFSGFHEYSHAIRWGDYSLLMTDGSFVQMEYEFSGKQLRWHRLCYFPSPVQVDVQEAVESEIDLIDVV